MSTIKVGLTFKNFWIEAVGRLLSIEESDQVFRCYQAHFGSCFKGSAADVGEENHVVHFQKPGMNFGLMFKDIKSGSGNLLFRQSLYQVGLSNDFAPCGVDDKCRRFHVGKRF